MTKTETDKSAHDYASQGKEPPKEVVEATLKRVEEAKLRREKSSPKKKTHP